MIGRLRALRRALVRDGSGATAIEYGLVAALISIGIVAWASEIGTSVTGFFTSVANGF